MSSTKDVVADVDLEAKNVGGIDRTSVAFEPGVTVLSGRNATNRTSLLEAIMAAHGSDRSSLKADAEAGRVELSMDDDTYECHLSRENGTVATSGTPYLEDVAVADLFAFLLEDNEARRAVERADDLRDIIMRPVDTEKIQAEIRELEDEKQNLDEQLEELETFERRLPDLEEEKTRLQERIEAKRSELETKQTELEEADASVDEERQAKAELESNLDDLREAQSRLEDVRYELETERDALESLRTERADLESEHEALSGTPAGDLELVEDRLADRHDRKQSITADLNQLQTIIQFNEEMLDSSGMELREALDDRPSEEDGGSVTDQLVDGEDTVTCWTCGTSADEERITGMVDDLREFRQRKLQERRELTAEIDELQAEKQDLESQQRRRERIERELAEHDDQIDESETTNEDLEARREDLLDRVATLEETVEELEQQEQTELLDLHKEVNQLEFDLERLEDELEEVDTEIRSVEDRLDDRQSIEMRREEVQADLEDLRTKVDRIEQEAVEEFNDHMEVVLGELGFENIERVWIERTEREVREGRRTVSKNAFDLHVVRETDEGTVYEDSAHHLSESEQEVVGLVFGLAGYLVHDVHESVPFMLLDSLEAIDSRRIAMLVDYFAEYADYLVVALLEEDAAALDDRYARITDI